MNRPKRGFHIITIHSSFEHHLNRNLCSFQTWTNVNTTTVVANNSAATPSVPTDAFATQASASHQIRFRVKVGISDTTQFILQYLYTHIDLSGLFSSDS